MTQSLKNILGQDLEEITAELVALGYPAFRTDQLLAWVYHQRIRQWDQMTNLPEPLRHYLTEHYQLRTGEVENRQVSADQTVKLLIRWPDGAACEIVLMKEGKRRTVCLSSQVGCPVACAFCASGLGGLERSLETAEIVEQVMLAMDQLKEDKRITNVVVMGMGEPFLNYDAVLKAVRIINADWGLGIGARHITISTIGIPAQIRRLSMEPLQLTLALSLHAPDDRLRAELIPWAKKYRLGDIFYALEDYFQRTHREVTLEYVLLEGVNTSLADADKLANWAKKSRYNVNLIQYNPVNETDFRPASAETTAAFLQRLQKLHVNVHLRKSKGDQIDAACGQLRRRPKST